MKDISVNSSIYKLVNRLKRDIYSDPDYKIKFIFQIYEESKKENYQIGMAFALLNLGRALFKVNKYEEAMMNLFESISISQKEHVCDLQLLANLVVGDIFFNIEEYEKSLDYYNCAERLSKILIHSNNFYKNVSIEYYTAKIYNNIGKIYRKLDCYEEAIYHFNLAAELDKKLFYLGTFGEVLSNIGDIQFKLGNYNTALRYLNESLIYLLKNEYKIGIIEAYVLLALTYEKKENFSEGERCFLKAMDLASKITYDCAKIDLLLQYSKFLERNRKNEAALEKLNEAYIISTGSKYYNKTMEICKGLINFYEAIGDVINCNKYYKIYFENESMQRSIKFQSRAKSLNLRLQLEKLEDENRRISEKNKIAKLKADKLVEVIKNISIISELGGKITTTLELEQICQMLFSTIQSFMKINNFGIGLYNKDERKISFPYYIQDNIKILMPDVSFDDTASMSAKCLKEHKYIVINDIYNEDLNYMDNVDYIVRDEKVDLNSAMFCPLIIDNNLIGVMTVQVNEIDSFSMFTIEMIKALSSYAAIGINNAIKTRSLVTEVKQRRKIQKQLEDLNKKLKYISENDGLTKIPNRRKLDEVIEKIWDAAKKENNSLSIIIFDIDYFKQYNDNYGHTEGDNCLLCISRALTSSLKSDYFAARYGGDEFVILLPNTSLDEAIIFGENFRKIVENLKLSHGFSKSSNFVTVTLGASTIIPNDKFKIIEFIKKADDALYEAKTKGKNQILGKQL